MEENRQKQIIESFKKIDPKVIADVLKDILRSDDGELVRKPPVNPSQNTPK